MITETPAAWNAAVEKTLADLELWGGWTQSASDVPKARDYFKVELSDADLIRIWFGIYPSALGNWADDDVYYAKKLAKARFAYEFHDLIVLEAAKIAEEMECQESKK